MVHSVQIKRVYSEAEPADGVRVLVDRLWPRGITKERASIDAWLKEIAPSSALRTWFGHRPELFATFTARYTAELDGNPAVQQLRQAIASHPMVTLVYAAKDEAINHAVVLADYLIPR